MTGPLIVLAIGTIVVGFIGLPHLSFLQKYVPNFLAEWLDPSLVDFGRPSLEGSIHQAHGTDIGLLTLMGIALGVGVVGILLASALYGRGPSAAVNRFTAGAGAEIYRLAKNKFFVDEAYDWIIVRPFRWIAVGVFEVIDRFLIDWVLVEGSAFVVDLFGRIARWFQNGQVQRYMVGLVVGGALILFFVTRPEADFDWQQVDTLTVQFEADVGKGPGSNGAEVSFDFDEDGTSDFSAIWKQGDPPVVTTWSFARPGEHEVSMTLVDAVFKKKGTVEKTVVLEEPEDGAQEGAAPKAATGGEGERRPVGAGGVE
jgi:NADH-quinone oxidoreductase subunit L